MNFQLLPSNPNPDPNTQQFDPNLLDTMETKQLVHSQQASSFKYYTPKQNNSTATSLLRKPQHYYHPYLPNQIPFATNYNLDPSQTQTKIYSNTISPPITLPPVLYSRRRKSSTSARVPRVINLSNVGKLSKMMKNFQTGMMVFIQQKGDVHSFLMTARWDNLIFYRGQNYHTYLMGEFYGNLVTKTNQAGLFVFDSVVQGQTIHVNMDVIFRALRIDPAHIPQPCINIYEAYKFNQRDFEIHIGFFCGTDAPIGLCHENCGISFKHFLPKFQQLAIILRANLLPKPQGDQYFDFIDLKIMYQLVTNRLEFNIVYVIILNMFLAFQLDYMPYGLLLTAVFDLFKIPTPRVFAQRVEYCRIENLVVEQVPLKKIVPYKYGPPTPPEESANRDYARENVILRSVIDELKIKNENNIHEIKALKNEILENSSKITDLEGKLGIEQVENGKKAVIELDDDVDFDSVCAGTVSVTSNLPNLTDFNAVLGIVTAEPNA